MRYYERNYDVNYFRSVTAHYIEKFEDDNTNDKKDNSASRNHYCGISCFRIFEHTANILQ